MKAIRGCREAVFTTVGLPEHDRCNAHLLGMGQRITRSIRKAGLTGYQFGTPAVSDGISMGEHTLILPVHFNVMLSHIT